MRLMAKPSPKKSSPYQPKQPPAPKPPALLADPRRAGPYNAGMVRNQPDASNTESKSRNS
jgi:hypothetical protein